MEQKMKQKSDEELIKIIEAAPDNAAAKLAKEMLEYRKYVAQRRQNSGILWLTIVLTISAIVQAAAAAIDVFTSQQVKSTSIPINKCINTNNNIEKPGTQDNSQPPPPPPSSPPR